MGRSFRFVGLVVLLLLLLVFGWTFFSTLFFPSTYEVLYKSEILVSTCDPTFCRTESEYNRCLTVYEIRVGNTGRRNQEKVRLKIKGIPSLKESERRLLDIFASNKKHPESVIVRTDNPSEKIYEISPLPENKVLILSFYATGFQDHLALKNLKLQIEARGKIINHDPQITVLARIFKKMFGIFF